MLKEGEEQDFSFKRESNYAVEVVLSAVKLDRPKTTYDETVSQETDTKLDEIGREKGGGEGHE